MRARRNAAFSPGWFSQVSAYRLATFRVVIALTTLLHHVPRSDAFLTSYVEHSFHGEPWFPWVPELTSSVATILIAGQHLAAWGLLLGLLPRLCAGALATCGLYWILLDRLNYSENVHFHLTLLALLACAKDGVPLLRLGRAEDEDACCPAWPERLLRLQMSIVFFFAALDKALNPIWGAEGTLLAELELAHHGPGLAVLQTLLQELLRTIPGTLSVLTIALEFFVALGLALPALRRAAIATASGFALLLDFLVLPGMFAWDLLALLILFVPCKDRTYALLWDPECVLCRGTRRALRWLDWMRRLRLLRTTEVVDGRALSLVGPRGSVQRGLDAALRTLLILPGPVCGALVVIRYASRGQRIGGVLAGPDLVFLLLGAAGSLWAIRRTRLGLWCARAALRLLRGALVRLGALRGDEQLCVTHAAAERPIP